MDDGVSVESCQVILKKYGLSKTPLDNERIMSPLHKTVRVSLRGTGRSIQAGGSTATAPRPVRPEKRNYPANRQHAINDSNKQMREYQHAISRGEVNKFSPATAAQSAAILARYGLSVADVKQQAKKEGMAK
jgi:hypothetical protein